MSVRVDAVVREIIRDRCRRACSLACPADLLARTHQGGCRHLWMPDLPDVAAPSPPNDRLSPHNGAAKDATARHATQDAANLGANLFMHGIHDIIDEVKLVFFEFFGIWFPHPTSLSIPYV